jgi:integrase
VKGGAEVVLPVHPELAPLLELAMGATRSEFVCPGDIQLGTQMPDHFDLEGRLRRTMAEAGVGITSFVHHCRAWHCGARIEVADNRPRSCPVHGPEHMHIAAKVRPLGFHDLRRSHASLLAHAGVSTAIAQKLMRHSDPKLTERVYTGVGLGPCANCGPNAGPPRTAGSDSGSTRDLDPEQLRGLVCE